MSNTDHLPIHDRNSKVRLSQMRIEETGMDYHLFVSFNVTLSNGSVVPQDMGPYLVRREGLLDRSFSDLVKEAYDQLPEEYRQ